MLLAPPDPALLAALAPVAEAPLDLERARQDFYDFLCVPQSGCYIPPYAHVLARGEANGEYWHFPPPRFDGGDALRRWYDAAGFDPAGTRCRSAHRRSQPAARSWRVLCSRFSPGC